MSTPRINCRPEGTLCELLVDSSIGAPAQRREAPYRAVAMLDPEELEVYLYGLSVVNRPARSLERIVAGPVLYR